MRHVAVSSMRGLAEVTGSMSFAHCRNPRRGAFERVARDGRIDLNADRPGKAAELGKNKDGFHQSKRSFCLDLMMAANE